MKHLLPLGLRVRFKSSLRYLSSILDFSILNYTTVTRKRTQFGRLFRPALSLSQPIRGNAYSENKKHNIRLALKSVQNLAIEPGEIFSFWFCVGAASASRGYKVGRTIVGGELNANVGGGLSQLSGAIYFLALQAGWEIIERHSPSLDLYNDETRYTPLGSDAAVAYGYKDVRIKNTSGFPASFRVEFEEDSLKVHLCSPRKIEPCQIQFIEKRKGDTIEVRTLRFFPNGQQEELAISVYKTYEEQNPVTSSQEEPTHSKTPNFKLIPHKAKVSWAD